MSAGERTLCEAPFRVALREAGAHVEVLLEAEPQLRFESTARALASALDELGLQLSSAEGYCRFESSESAVQVRYARNGSATRFCEIPAAGFGAALAWFESF